MQIAQLRAASEALAELNLGRGECLPDLPMNLVSRGLQGIPILPRPSPATFSVPPMTLFPLDSPRVKGAGRSRIRLALAGSLAIGRAALALVVLATVVNPTKAQFAQSTDQTGPLGPPSLMVSGYDGTTYFGAAMPATHAQPADIGPPPLLVTGYEVSPVVMPEDTVDAVVQESAIDDPPFVHDHPMRACPNCDPWHWQLLPDGLIYRSYLAGFREPRMHSLWAYEDELGVIWDIALGGRVGLLRYGTCDNAMPDGWQIDMEGAAFPRLDPEEESDLVAADFRAGVPFTYGNGPIRTKLAYYHLSSHLGDEYLLKNPTVTRYNYSRDVLVLGQSFYLNPDLRIYAEAGWAFVCDVSEEWEFQFGVDYSPLVDTRGRGAPFMALNGHLREEVDFGGNFVVQVGWQWRQAASGHLLRLGLEYFNGKSDQFEFFDRYENKVGLAIWYDY